MYHGRKTTNYNTYNFKRSFFRPDHPFYAAKIGLETMMYLIYEFIVSTEVMKVAHEYSISGSSVTRYYKILRGLTIDYYLRNEPRVISGPGLVIEWDETLLVKNKYRVGRQLSGQKWLFDGVVRGNTKQCFVEHVSRRDAETLAAVVRRRIAPGSIIHSDMWRAYP